jgi:hypothetical protein
VIVQLQDNTNEGGGAEDDDGGDKRSARPSTARRRPPKVKDGAKEVQSKDVAPTAARKTEGIIIDGQTNDVSSCCGCCGCCLLWSWLVTVLWCSRRRTKVVVLLLGGAWVLCGLWL